MKLGQLEIFADTLAISEVYLTIWAAHVSNSNKISYTYNKYCVLRLKKSIELGENHKLFPPTKTKASFVQDVPSGDVATNKLII